MVEVLAKKKCIQAGHKASATKTMGKVDDILGMDSPDVSILSLLKLTLQEKLETIRVLDSEIVELIDDEAAVTTEIEQTDGYRVYSLDTVEDRDSTGQSCDSAHCSNGHALRSHDYAYYV